jgi:hypothetical protein
METYGERVEREDQNEAGRRRGNHPHVGATAIERRPTPFSIDPAIPVPPGEPYQNHERKGAKGLAMSW